MGDLAVIEQNAEQSCTAPTAMRCGAKNNDGTICKQWPVKNGNGRCRRHNGAALSGFALPQTKHGRYSKHLPTRLQSRFHEAEQDATLLHLRGDVALLETRLSDVLEQLGDQTSSELLESIKKCWDLYQKAIRSGKEAQIDEARFQLNAAIESGYNEAQNWREARAIILERTVVSKEERTRLKEMQQTLSVQEANVLLGAVAHAIMQRVSNKEERALLAQDLAQLTRIER